MREGVVESVAMAFRGLVEPSREALARGAADDVLAGALWSFAAADYEACVRQVAEAGPEQSADRSALRSALRSLVQVECEGCVVVPVDETLVDPRSPVSGLVGYLMTETAYSAGLLERAVSISQRVLSGTGAGDPFVPWVRITRIRVLAFLGLVDEAEAELSWLVDEVGDWPIGEAVIACHTALVAGVRGDADNVLSGAERVRELIPRPADQLSGMTLALTGLALSTIPRPDLAIETLEAVGDDLRLLPVVSRCHAGDLAVESCLLLGRVDDARRHLRRSESYGVEPGSFCGAAVERSQARLAAFEDAGAPDAGPHAQMYLTRERAFADLAALPTSPADVEELTRLVAGEGLAAVRVWAGREPGSEESTLRLFAGLGWDALPAQTRVVARLAAAGMRNKEIAERMFLAEKTVESHVAAVLATLGAETRVGIGARTSFTVAGRSSVALTPRQVEIARLVADGLGNREIAQRLSITDKTVEKHVKALFAALDVRSRAGIAAVVRAL
ncbi:helix-turn-helix transcriptional regulator [Aeromicrobium stalagmiti]|uniref:helix-turn-helix transcriptional regulator n=1 Tax=Aeromicrobium stalagmiti TaxID=2738988 RepID=UPI001568E8AE|nr:hypothetical protein [Aeromicrobium stalagmiti]